MFGKTKTVTFGVDGMMCKNCKAHVEKALLEVKGVVRRLPGRFVELTGK